MDIFADELVKVSVPAVTALFTVVFPAAEKVALSPDVQVTPLVPFHHVDPPVQLPLPPAVEVPAELQVTFAALEDCRIVARASTQHAHRAMGMVKPIEESLEGMRTRKL
jgi:hypothetical protein